MNRLQLLYGDSVGREELKADFMEFVEDLDKHMFLVSGNTPEELDAKDLDFSYSMENPKTLVDDFTQVTEKHIDENTQDYMLETTQRKPRLNALQFELTSRCNERCIHCYIPNSKKNTGRDMPTEKVLSLIDEFAEMGGLHVTLSGGEVFMHKDVIRIMQYCREKDMMISILSNLIALRDEQIPFIKEANISLLQTSLYSMNPEIHDTITTVKGSFAKTKAAIEKCRSAGIRPIMITGDHKDTAVAIAKELGILKEGQMAVTGAELDAIPDEVFAHDVRKYSVYARVQPENKVRIVDAWQALGCITAMTGDGVNDAPAIKSADIGVGMGITGTDVTKSVADMILTDDNFATIVSAVAEGRRIYDNIRKAIQFLLSANLAEVLAVFISTLLGFTIFRPVHILWINLITDTFPAISLGMEEAESDTMNRPPRSPKESIFAGGLGFDVILEGCIISALTILSYFTGYRIENGVWGIGQSPAGMTMAFLTLSMMEIFHSFNLRSRRRSLFTLPHQNKWLWGTLVFSTAITAAVVFIPALRNVFSFAPVSLKDYGLAMLIAVSIIPIMEIVKFFSRLASK